MTDALRQAMDSVLNPVEPIQIDYNPVPTIERFHQSQAYIRGVLGPIGSGKTAGCLMEIMHRAVEQQAYKKVRRTRWAVIRNTYPELKSTTIKTFRDWIPDAICKWNFGSPITCVIEFPMDDGTKVWAEVLFISCDRPDDVGKLKSLNLTGVFINEASEIAKEIFDMAFGRIGRFPNKKEGGHTWCGLWMDTNAPDDDHWYYQLAEAPDEEMLEALRKVLREISGEDRPLCDFYKQPGGLLYDERTKKWSENPASENIDNLTEGYGYYFRQTFGKSITWCNVYLRAMYGTVGTGKPVYPDYNDHLHVAAATIDPMDGVDLICGMDFGLNPAFIPGQITPRGRLLILGEVTTPEHGAIGVRQFINDWIKPYLVMRFGSKSIPNLKIFGDPAGTARAQADSEANNCFDELNAAGLRAEPAKTNVFVTRRDAVTWFLTRMVGGEPAFQLDPSAKMLRKGFNGRYFYERVQNSGEEARYHDEPVKNKYSHPHDALQYLALHVGSAGVAMPKPDTRPSWQRELGKARKARPFMHR
jgi:hypothetical protein